MADSEMLRERLSDMGFEVEENEEEALDRALARAEQTIINYCNCESVPEELQFAMLDMAAGEYLSCVSCHGGEGDNVKSLSEGDVSITFGEDGIEAKVDELFSRGREEMTAFRRVKW